VGLPLSLLFADSGFDTTGFDVDPKKVECLGRGESYIKHISPEAIQQVSGQKEFRATSDFSGVSEMDAIIICVPTPLDGYRQPAIPRTTWRRKLSRRLRRTSSWRFLPSARTLEIPNLRRPGFRRLWER
jgi:UDP-N-acetyl-D-mannosaminuronate dehydrogenase